MFWRRWVWARDHSTWQGLNWWGAAANLQREDEDPWAVARHIFVERHPHRIDNEIDRSLLDRALN